MRGYYCIYNHASNCWWTSGGWWMGDFPFILKSIPTNIELTDWWTTDGDKKYVLQKNEMMDAYFHSDTQKNPYNILTFETLNEAETYLLSGRISKGHTDFFTIRKIYF